MMQKRKPRMTADLYRLMAEAVRTIDNPAVKQSVANHFAKHFHAKSKAFDPQRWYEETGGKVLP